MSKAPTPGARFRDDLKTIAIVFALFVGTIILGDQIIEVIGL
jgi:hypothetical protein